MTNDFDPSDDVNEVVKREWKDKTTPFERVRTVMRRTYEPQAADEIADRARTTPTTARKHLRQLEESGFVGTISREKSDATLYRRTNDSLVLEQARDMLERVSSDELALRVTEMREEIQTYREELGVDSPADAALSDADADRATLRDWQTTRRNLAFAKVALALAEADAAVRSPSPVREDSE